jgi:hypothetical protein
VAGDTADSGKVRKQVQEPASIANPTAFEQPPAVSMATVEWIRVSPSAVETSSSRRTAAVRIGEL